MKKADDACKKFATPNQCGERAAGLGSAGPPLVFTPPPITQRITQLLTGLDSYAAAPTAWQLDQMKLLQTMLTENAAAARKLTQDELAALNKSMNEAGVAHIVIAPQRAGGGGFTPPEE